MDHYKTTGKVDPDYESYKSALELNEEEDKKENLVKLTKIIEETYNRDIVERQDQIERIELQICKARKLLHLLRYAIIMSYYKKKELECSGTEEENPIDLLIPPDEQNRIHPAIKKLLGSKFQDLEHLTLKNKRKSSSRTKTTPPIEEEPPQDLPQSKRIKLETSPKPLEHPTSNDNNTSRRKTRYRIIVGNISKWMPSSEDDLLTHKWMVYVRGPKDKSDISHFVEKIVCYLHPSYKPYDVVEVTESPFHLSRRGWGEFPVRIQIFFKVTLNKPIDVVHNIKLDQTYSGRQTLGNETVIDVLLYDNSLSVVEPEFDEDDIFLEHSYSLPPSQEGQPKAKNEKIEQDMTNRLIYGLDSSYAEGDDNETKTSRTINSLKQLVQLNKKDIKFNNTKIIVVGKTFEGSFLANLGRSTQNSVKEKVKIILPMNKLKNVGEALFYLFKKIPLNLEQFGCWNVGRRRNAEWSRARTIKKLLLNSKLNDIGKWNTKAVLMFGRSHEFTPFVSNGLFRRNSNEKALIMNCYSNSKSISKSVSKYKDPDQDLDVNIDSDVTSPEKIKLIDVSNPVTMHECGYVRQKALEVGVILKSEEIGEGLKMNCAEVVILEAVKCLADNLIRRARNHRICTTQNSCNGAVIDKEDVEVAINERPEVLSLKHFKNDRRNEFLL